MLVLPSYTYPQEKNRRGKNNSNIGDIVQCYFHRFKSFPFMTSILAHLFRSDETDLMRKQLFTTCSAL